MLLARTHDLPTSTRDELSRLRPGEIVVVGGPASLSDAVVAELARYTTGSVVRRAGTNRFATAADVAEGTFTSGAATVFVANAFSFPDALAAGPAADAHDAPLLGVTAAAVPAETEAAIGRLGATRAVILGGDAVVSRAVEDRLRQLVGRVDRWAGHDRHATSSAVATQVFAPGVPTVYLATGAGFADALAGGPAAAAAGGPVLLAHTNCIPKWVDDTITRLAPAAVVLLGGEGALGPGVEQRTVCPYGAAPQRPGVWPGDAPAFDDDAPDPQIVRFDGRWYAYTTGTTWGNKIGVLVSDQVAPTGWRTASGREYGSRALGPVPGWQVDDTQWAPGVIRLAGRYVMFYAAQARAHGDWCISVATATSPTGPFNDSSTAPIVCQRDLGGSIDPQPFLDVDGRPWLHWKNNDGEAPGNVDAVSKVWAAPLTADGTGIAGPYREVMAKSDAHPWMQTVDNPQMVVRDGVHYLFFTGGSFRDDTYAVGYAVCAGPTGPCHLPQTEPILRSYGDVAGPGGGTVAVDAEGRWWIAYHAWPAGACTSYSCGAERKLYVGGVGWG